MPRSTSLELAVFSAQSAILAARCGADRLELCASYAQGGVTPSLETLQTIVSELSSLDKSSNTSTSPSTSPTTSPSTTSPTTPRIPIHIMIRPRGGPFTYTTPELQQMHTSIAAFLATGLVSGFVFGVLTPSGAVDSARNSELVRAAGGLPCTFHRAIDAVVDVAVAWEIVVACGFSSVLTSGGVYAAGQGAWEGREGVRKLRQGWGGRVSVVAGGGVRSGNVEALVRETGVRWVHSAAVVGEGEEVDEGEVRRIVEVLERMG